MPPSLKNIVPLMRKILALLILAASAAVGQAQESHIAAVINDDVVTDGDVDARARLVELSSNIPDTAENEKRLKPQVLRSLIDEKLQLQEAKRLNLSVKPDEVKKAIERLEARNNLQPGGLAALLKSHDIPMSTLEDQIKASLAFEKIVEGRVSQDVQVSDDEVNDAMKRLKADVGKPQNRVAEIFLAVDNPSQDAEVKQTADRIIQQIRSGANFAAVAQQFSQSPSAAVGGDIGWVTQGELSPLLGEAISKMNPGQMSYPIRTSAGYYILYLMDRRTLGAVDPNQVTLSLDEVVFPVPPDASPDDRQRAETAAQQVSNEAKSCGEMAKIGSERAPQLSRQVPQIRAADLPADVRQKILALKIAEASQPMTLEGGIGVVMVCDRHDPTSLPTRNELSDSIARQRLDALARRYMQDLRRGAFVDVRG
jgi:peptidyl-prolyl cis-trans isomerase SurA